MTPYLVAVPGDVRPRLRARQVTCVMQPLYGDACGRQVISSVMKRGKKKSKKANASRRSDCADACTLDLIGDRWTLLIVRDLVRGKRYFDDFLRSSEGIATNVLSARLRELCKQGLVEKTRDPSDRRRYTYELNGDGQRLVELLGNIADWGLKYLPGTKVMSGMKPPQGS